MIVNRLIKLAHSQIIMPDLETPYSQASFPNANYSGIQLKDRTIGTVITEHKEQLNAVLHEISDLETVMDSIQNLHQQLVGKKEKVIKSINLHKSLVSALWRLPTEVLSHIFHRCLPEIREFNQWKKPSVLEAPILLTTVCRRWREVAVAMPSLWCRLAVSESIGEGQWERQIFFYKIWLKRSRGYPLSLVLYAHNCVLYDWTKILRFLHPHTNQISSLCIHLYYRERQMSQTQPILNVLCPALQKLTIVAWNAADPDLVRSISRLSTLRSLQTQEPPFNVELLSLFNPVWAHLTNITINIDGLDSILHLLRLAPNLCSVHTIVLINEITDLEPFTHTKLQSLRITCDSDFGSTSRLSQLFDALSLPNLRIFEISGEPPWPHEKFKAFLTRSNCPLETLILGAEVETEHKQRAEYVSLIPSLEIVASEEDEEED
ncbi:hypothetical protein EDB19DRAFT_893702 [Suillus lakei]|nr:hypothetical protein EDB19DRAFT_893702 [Suillus lakei]